MNPEKFEWRGNYEKKSKKRCNKIEQYPKSGKSSM